MKAHNIDSKKYLEEFSKYVIMDPYPFVIDLKGCNGMWIKTIDDTEIFDWAGYYGSRLIGHNHPMMFEKDYIETLIYAANNKMANPDFLTPECIKYYRKLYELAPKCIKNDQLEIYAVNSGAEAVENMLKYFINLHDNKMIAQNKPIGMRRMIYFEQAFHGRTIYTLNVTKLTHVPVITKNFENFGIGNLEAPFPVFDPNISEEENQLKIEMSLNFIMEQIRNYPDEIVGVIVEPIQSAGGQRIALPKFFQELSRICYENDISLGFDEVQTAGGQTGKIFMSDFFDLPYPPQGIATGKKFANGVVYMRFPMQDIGILDSTWGGNLADMVRFCQEMKVVEKYNLIEQVEHKTEMIVQKLTDLQDEYPHSICHIRGQGLYQGFSMCDPKKRNLFVDFALQEQNLLLLEAATDTIRLRPVLDVEIHDIDLLIKKLEICIKSVL